MKSRILLIFMSSIVLFAITACSDGSTGLETANDDPQINAGVSTTNTVTLNSSSGIDFTITDSQILEGVGKGKIPAANYSVEATLTRPNSHTLTVDLTSEGLGSTPHGTTVDGAEASARNMVTHASYDGGSSIAYTVKGQQKTASLEPEHQNMLTQLHQDYETAETAYNNMPPETEGSNPLLSKTDQQIKQMLESKGYTVTILGDMKFEITKTIGSIETTEVFDAETFAIESEAKSYVGDSEYSEYFQGGTYQPVRSLNQ